MWNEWTQLSEGERIPKATLPFEEVRRRLAAQHTVALQGPAACKKKPSMQKRRRTPFNLSRAAGVIRAGACKRSLAATGT